MENIILSLKNDYVEVKIEKDGLIENKVIDYETYMDLVKDEKEYDSDILPGEYGIKYIHETSNGDTIYIYVEPARKIEYRMLDTEDEEDYKEYESVTPILVWYIFKSHEGYIKPKVFAMKNPPFIMSEPIYRAPFSNIYESGEICWGDSVRPNLDTPLKIQGLSYAFFNGIDNFDLSENRVNQFERFSGYNGFTPAHLHSDIGEQLSEGSLTIEGALEKVHSVLMRENRYLYYDSDRYDFTFNDLIEAAKKGVNL